MIYLAGSPRVQEKLQRELSGASEVDILEGNLPYLEACISETLRMNPPVPSGVPRISPPEGIPLSNGDRIPGGVGVLFPLYSVFRDPRLFDRQDVFWPERVCGQINPSSQVSVNG